MKRIENQFQNIFWFIDYISNTPIIYAACPIFDTDYFGNNLYGNGGVGDLPTTNTWEECGKMCHDEPGCTHWSWLGNQVGNLAFLNFKCLLKTSSDGETHFNGAISGDKTCTSQGKFDF